MVHSPGFLKLVNEARPEVKEITIKEARQKLANNPNALLIDVREDHEWQKGHAAEALHLGKGILERDLEQMVPDFEREMIMYCGGGYRSVPTSAAAGRIGDRNPSSPTSRYTGRVPA